MQKCQSCAMPMKKDPEGGGRNKDGTRSGEYCSLCYGDGVFYYRGTDAIEYQKFVFEQLQNNGWWKPIAWLATREIPRLKRWQ